MPLVLSVYPVKQCFSFALLLLKMKNDVNAVLGEAGMDTLPTSEWTKLEEMANLLAPLPFKLTPSKPIACHFLLSCLPSLMDLECHLQQSANRTMLDRLARPLLFTSKSTGWRFQSFTCSCLLARPHCCTCPLGNSSLQQSCT